MIFRLVSHDDISLDRPYVEQWPHKVMLSSDVVATLVCVSVSHDVWSMTNLLNGTFLRMYPHC
jgi:hypothetical protein